MPCRWRAAVTARCCGDSDGVAQRTAVIAALGRARGGDGGKIPLGIDRHAGRLAFGIAIDELRGMRAHQNGEADEFLHYIDDPVIIARWRSEEHTSELQSLMRKPYAVLCL